MEKEKKYVYQGFTLHSEEELSEVKKEAEAIAYIRSQANLNDVKVALKIYNRLVEKGTLVTVLGVDFLAELRKTVTDSGVVAESSLKPLPEAKKYSSVFKEGSELTRDQKLLQLYKGKVKNLKIVIAALLAVIAAMFAIRLFGNNSPFVDYESKVLDEYAGWKDELSKKEEELHNWEQELTQWEYELRQQEESK